MLGFKKRNNRTAIITEYNYNSIKELNDSINKLNKSNKIRIQIAKRYNTELNILEKMPWIENCCYHLYWIRVRNRKKFREKLSDLGIETGTHYSPVHLMSYYNSKVSLPVTQQVGDEIVTLPMHPNLTNDDVSTVIKAVNSFI